MNFQCFPKRNKQASHLNVCLLLLRVLVCMRLKKIDFCCQLGTSSYVSCPTLYMFHHLCSPVSSNPSDGLQPPRFQPWTMTLSSWWLVSSGGILSTTLWIQTFSTDHLLSAISNRMTSTSAAFPVFLLLFCMLFPRFLILWAASTVILLETLRNRPLQETAKHTILYPCSLPSSLHFRAFTFMWLHTIFFPWHVQLYCDQRLRLLGH